ncbi:MAG: hypothetical protein KAI95_11590, partial [Bacteroidales bacterium]|nr:hypothetical protein [Bacteroidales bacterium]
MKKIYMYLTFLCCFLVSCQTGDIKNVSLEGDLYAKNLIRIQCDLPRQAEDQQYSWYLSPSTGGEWEKLQGIWTDEIV